MAATNIKGSPGVPTDKVPISAIILVRNEEENIAGVLENILDLADELIVMDMQSEDKTVEIAMRYTSHVYSHPLIRGFNAARNPARDRASHEWILIMDADERLPEKLKAKFREVVENDIVDYVVNQRRNYVLGYPLRYGEHREDWGTRLFKNRCAAPYVEGIHEALEFHGRKLTLPDEPDLTVLHYTNPTIDSLISRLQRYTPHEAVVLERMGYVFSPLKLIAKPASYLIRSYILKQGFRDGVPGLIYAIYYAFYFFLARARFWEKMRRGKSGGSP